MLTSLVFGLVATTGQEGDKSQAGLCKTQFAQNISREWVDRARATDAQKIAANAALDIVRRNVQKFGFQKVASGRPIQNHNSSYTHEVKIGRGTNQDQSGRCHLFAACNVVRSIAMSNEVLPDNFEFSENYLYFYEMLEKANFYLIKAMEGIIGQLKSGKAAIKISKPEFVGKGPRDPGLEDGGWWTWDAYLIHKYGLVPKSVMPETSSSMNSSSFNHELVESLTFDVKTMIDIAQAEINEATKPGAKRITVDALKERIRKKLEAQVNKSRQEVWDILVTHLGTPPSPNEVFEFRLDPKGDDRVPSDDSSDAGEEGVYRFSATDPNTVYKFTPLSFVSDFLRVDVRDFVVVTSNPFRPREKFYEISDSSIAVPQAAETFGNLQMLNVTNDRLKALVVSSIKKRIPIWFGADVSEDVDYKTHIMHPDVFRSDDVYGWPRDSRSLSLADRLRMRMSELNHAMMFAGFDQPGGPDSPIVKLKVENSWEGHQIFHMYPEWFAQYVFMAVIPKSVLSKAESDAIQQKPEVIREKDWEIP